MKIYFPLFPFIFSMKEKTMYSRMRFCNVFKMSRLFEKSGMFFFLLLFSFLSGCDTPPSLVQKVTRDNSLNIIPITQITGTSDTLTQVGLPYEFIAVKEVDGKYVNVTNQVTWHSSNPDIVAIEQGQATGKNKGVTRIHAQLIQSQPRTLAQSLPTHSSSNEIEFIVKDEPLLMLQINTSEDDHPIGTLNNRLPVHTKQNLNAIATYADNTSFDVSNVVDWKSSDQNVLKITNAKANMLTQGSSNLQATFLSNKSNILSFTVTDAEIGSISIIPAKATTAAQSHQEFIAIAHYSDGTNQDVTKHVSWTSQNQSIATVTQGEAKALRPGSTQIRASLRGVSSDPSNLIVTNATLRKLKITPSKPKMNLGSDMFYKVKAIYDDDSTDDISDHVLWESSQPDVSTVIAAYAKASNVGQTNITAVFQGIRSNTSLLSVTDHQLLSLQLTPSVIKIANGTEAELRVIATYDDGENADITDKVTWKSSEPKIVYISAGHIGAMQVGESNVHATFEGITSNVSVVRVINAEITAFQVTPAIETVAVDDTVKYLAQATFSDTESDITTQQDVSHFVVWKSKHVQIASFARGSATGVTHGTATISAKLGNENKEAILNVDNKTLISLQVTPALQNLPKGSIAQYTAMGTYEDNITSILSNEDVTHLVNWSTTNNALATVYNGEIEAVNQGLVYIGAEYKNIKSNQASLTVEDIALITIQIEPESASLFANNTIQLHATGYYSDGSNQDITDVIHWASADTNKATVIKGKVSGHAQGAVNISANFSGVVAKNATVVVKEDKLLSVTVTPEEIRIAEGTTAQFIAMGRYSSDIDIDITQDNDVMWTSDSPAFLTIDIYGLATAVSAKEGIKVSATKDGETDDAIVNISAPTMNNLTIYKRGNHSGKITRGTKLAIIASAEMSNGITQDVSNLVSWHESSNSQYTTITAAGWVQAILPGKSIITATYKGKDSNEIEIETLGLEDRRCDISEITISSLGKNLTYFCPVTTLDYPTDSFLTGNGGLAPGGTTIPLVTWNEANQYCEDKGITEGDNRRLPTRAELNTLVSSINKPNPGGPNLYVDYGWQIQRNYWSSTENTNRYWTVNLRTRDNELSGPDDGKDYSFICVKEN